MVLLGKSLHLVIELIDWPLQICNLSEILLVLTIHLLIDWWLLLKHILQAINVSLEHALSTFVVLIKTLIVLIFHLKLSLLLYNSSIKVVNVHLLFIIGLG